MTKKINRAATPLRLAVALAAALTIGTALTAPEAAAQGQPFAPAATVNGFSISNFQVTQRSRFLSLLGAPRADLESVRDTLIDEVLQLQAARQAGVAISPDELDRELVQFAARANLTPPQFLQILQQNGIAPETYRDFVRAGITWRQFVQQRFGPQSQPTQSEVQRTLARGGNGVRVLLSEIAIPQTPENREEIAALARRLSEELTSSGAFAAAAGRYSRSGSAGRGGRLDWVDLAALPAPIVSQVLALAPGETSNPVDLGSYVGLYQLRDLDESGVSTPDALSVDYAEYLIPGGLSPAALSQAAAVRASVDSCDDLYGLAKDQTPGTLTRTVAPVADLPADLRSELAKLDEDEASTVLTRGQFLRFVMLCERVVEPAEGEFEAIGQSLLSQRLASYAQGYLDELRADAIITIE